MRFRPVRVAVALLAVSVTVLTGVVTALVVVAPWEPQWVLVLIPIVSSIYTVAGVAAWQRRPANLVGAILIVGGIVWLIASMANTDVAVLIAAGQIVATAGLAVIVHLLLAFPSGRLRDRASRVTAVAGYVVAIVLEAPRYLFASDQPAPFDVLRAASHPVMRDVGVWVQRGAGLAVMSVTGIILWRRLRAAPAWQRRVLAPLYVYGTFAVLALPLSFSLIRPLFDIGVLDVVVFQLVIVALVPVAFAMGILRGGFARTAEIDELGAWLGAEEPTRPALRDALARALGDPSVELSVTSSDGNGHMDAGTAAAPIADDRGVATIWSSGRPIGEIVYDTTALPDAAVVNAAGRVIAMAVDRERLIANLRASRDALRESRVRIMETADAERRRIAQDLHDGLQSTLILLGVEAERVGADTVRDGLDEAITELRSFVRGIMPPLLVEQGLVAATEDLAQRLPVPVRLDLAGPPTRPSPRAETAAYFVIAEALTNAVKHSHANALNVRIGHDGDTLSIEVRDDGVGGATADAGRGLRGIADRVDALGGSLRVHSSQSGGTDVIAELPCAS